MEPLRLYNAIIHVPGRSDCTAASASRQMHRINVEGSTVTCPPRLARITDIWKTMILSDLYALIDSVAISAEV